MRKAVMLKFAGAITGFALLSILVLSLGSADASSRAFSQVQMLTTSDGHMRFGNAVAIDGDTLLVGASTEENGAAYIFTQTNGQWIETQKLVGNGTAEFFGHAVALEGDTALVGAVSSPVGEHISQGAVYVFKRINDLWTQTQRLTSDMGGDYDYFGYALVLQGNDVFIGAPYQLPHGKVYWFEAQNGLWTQTGAFVPGDVQWDDHVGSNLALDGDTLIVESSPFSSANAGVYAFIRQNDTWVEQTKFAASDPEADLSGAAIQGDTVMLNAAKLLSPPPAIVIDYSISVFQRTGSTWVEEASLREEAGDLYQLVGNVEFNSDFALVRAVPRGFIPEGVYVFKNTAGSWAKHTILTVAETYSDDDFGYDIALDDPLVLIGAPNWNDQQGAAYIFANPDPVLTPTPTPTPTATATATATLPPDDGVELLVNGGFETDGSAERVPDGWTLKHGTKDKRKCNTAEKVIAFEGACVFEFKGSADERSKLLQNVDLDVHPVGVGDTLTLSGVVWAKGDVDSQVMLKVKYAALPTQKIVVEVSNPTGKQWIPFSALQPSLSLTTSGVPSEIQLQIKHRSASGKVRYDALSVMRQSGGLLPLGVPQ